MNKYLLSLILLLFITLFSCRKDQLSTKEKTEDFLYLYEVLDENYPYFDLAKRKYGVDWLAGRDKYLGMIRKTANDTIYMRSLKAILSELHDGHADMYPTVDYKVYLDAFKAIASEMPEFNPWRETLEKDSSCAKYWSEMLRTTDRINIEEEKAKEIISKYSDTIIADKKIAIMSIPSFMGEFISLDSLRIDRFLTNLHKVNTLIINIQGNSGGSTHYWQSLIVPRLISDTIKYSYYLVIKEGAINRKFFPGYFEPGNEIDKEDPFYKKIPDYFLDGSFRIIKDSTEIIPDNPVDFDGTIYLLVDDSVFSASEAFACFAQKTGWALVAGRQTSGDGIGRDPIVISLPNSGIKVRFVGVGGFNADGSLNAEQGTTPDWLIVGKSKNARLEELIYKITENVTE